MDYGNSFLNGCSAFTTSSVVHIADKLIFKKSDITPLSLKPLKWHPIVLRLKHTFFKKSLKDFPLPCSSLPSSCRYPSHSLDTYPELRTHSGII